MKNSLYVVHGMSSSEEAVRNVSEKRGKKQVQSKKQFHSRTRRSERNVLLSNETRSTAGTPAEPFHQFVCLKPEQCNQTFSIPNLYQGK